MVQLVTQTFELSALQQSARLFQREELLDGHKVVVHAGNLPVPRLPGRTCGEGEHSDVVRESGGAVVGNGLKYGCKYYSECK